MEPSKVAAELLRHPRVTGAVVVASEDEGVGEGSVAYVTANFDALKRLQKSDSGSAGADVVARWNRLYEMTYSGGPEVPSFVGWNSSLTRKPIPDAEMREWLRASVERIRALSPRRVLEIGCGTGLLLQQLAGECVAYVGTDLSEAALARVRQWLGKQEGLSHVELLHCAATELPEFDSSFDTVVLNSVVQYFPNIEYLLAVLRQAVRLCPGGTIFVGDVRHLGLLPHFHTTTQVAKASASTSVRTLRRRVKSAVSQERELAIDPGLFYALPGRLAGISSVEVLQKRNRVPEELAHFRYDAVLHTCEVAAADVEPRVAEEANEWRAYANDPLENSIAQQLIMQLREYLAERVPTTALPSDWQVVKQLPGERK